MKPISIEYIAGLFDGEGAICVSFCKSGALLREIRISNNNKEVLDDVCAYFGVGKVVKGNTGRWYNWVLHRNNEVIDVLKQLLPHLRIKKERAELMIRINLLSHGPGYHVPQLDRNQQVVLAGLIQEANKK